MGCLLPVIALFFPRLVMIFIGLLTHWFSQAWDNRMWPILGWFFLPYTTLAYMAAMLQNDHKLSGGWIVLVVIAVLVDLGAFGAGSAQRSEE